MTAQVAADLRAAAEVLRRDGWTQGGAIDRAGRRCPINAIFVATGGRPSRENPAYHALAETLPGGVVDWNETPGRTADEVIAALEAAADAAEAQS